MENKPKEQISPITHQMEIENQSPLVKGKGKLHFIDEFSKLYAKSSMANYIRKIKNEAVLNYITEIVVLTESNCINEIVSKVIYVEYFSRNNYFTTNEIEILIICFDKIIQKNKDQFYRFAPIFKAMFKLFTSKKAKSAKIKLDWKIYYELFLIYFTKTSFEFQFRSYFLNKDKHFINKFYLKLHKYITLLPEDILFLREEIKNLLFSGNTDKYNHAIGILTGFLRKNKDFYNEEMQNILFDLFSNNLSYNNIEIYGIFGELVKKNKLLINKEIFLNKIMEKLHENVITRNLNFGQGLLIRKNPISNGKNDERKQKNIQNFAQSKLFFIISYFLIIKDLKDLEDPLCLNLQNLIKNKLQIIFNILNSNLKENTSNDEIKYNLSNVKLFLCALKQRAFKKLKNQSNNKQNKEKDNDKSEKESSSEKTDLEKPPAEKLELLENLDMTFEHDDENEDEETKEKNIEYQIIPELTSQLESVLIEFIEPFITKSLFYQLNNSNDFLYEIAEISESLPNVFLKDNIFNIFMLLLNDENANNCAITVGNSNWVLVKINCFLKNFFKKLLSNNLSNSNIVISNLNNENITLKSLQSRFNYFISDSIKKISSANIENSSHIIKFLSRVYNIARVNYKEITEKYPALLKTLEDNIQIIYKKIIDLIEMISNKKFYTTINFFFLCSAAYLNNLKNKSLFNKHCENIEKIILAHLKENVLEEEIIGSLHSLIALLNTSEKKFYQSLFDFIYNNLVLDKNSKKNKKDTSVVNNEDDFEKSELFPGVKIRRNVELDQLNEKNLKYMNILIDYLDCRYINFNEENTEKIYNLIGLLSRSKDIFYLRILKSLANFIFNIVNKNIICYKNKEEDKIEEKIIFGEKLESLSLKLKEEENANDLIKEDNIKITLPDAEKLKFCLSFIKNLLNPLSENLQRSAMDFSEKLNLKAQKESCNSNAKWKTLKNKKLKKKIKKESLEEIKNNKSQIDSAHFKLLLGLAKRLNVLKNIFLLIPHKKNEKLYKHLYEDFNTDNNPENNSVKLLEDFTALKTELNKKIINSRQYFNLYKQMKTKEILEYYLSFDNYDYAEKITYLKKFNSEHKGLLKKFKNKEKQIFSQKLRMIYFLTHLDLIKNFSHSDLPKEKSKLTILIHKILLNCPDNKFRRSYTLHMNYLFLKLQNKKDKKSFIDLNFIYNNIKKCYESVLDKLNPEETLSITAKTKLANLVYAYSVFVNFFVDSPAIEYSMEKANEEDTMQIERENTKEIKSFDNDFKVHKLFLDFLEMKTKLYKQNIKELNFIVVNINIVYYNFFRFFPCSDFIINKKLMSKPDFLHFLDYKKKTPNTNLINEATLLKTDRFKSYFIKEKKKEKINQKIKFYTERNTENQIESKKKILEYFRIFLENLKSNNNKVTNNIYLNYLMKFEAIYLMYYSMDLENGYFHELLTDFQEYLLNVFISDSGFLEKKFCFYLIGFISKLKYKVIIEYKVEKFEEVYERNKGKFDMNLSEDEKKYQIKLNYFNKNKQALDPKCPSDVHYFIEKTLNYENLTNGKELKNNAYDMKIVKFLSDHDKMKKFLESYLLLKDNHKDQILNAELNEINSTAKKIFGTDLTSTMDKLLLPIVFPGKSEAETSISYSRGGTLLSTIEANMIFYTFIVYNFNGFDMLNKIFSELQFKIRTNANSGSSMNVENAVEQNLDHLHMTVYLTFSSAYLRKMTLNNKLGEKEIKDQFYFPLRQYGKITAEKVNREILTYYYFLLFNCSIEQLALVLYDNINLQMVNSSNVLSANSHDNWNCKKNLQELLKTENLILLKDNDFSNNRLLLLKFLNIFSEQNRSTKFIFEKSTFLKFYENFLFNLLDYPVEIIKNLNNYTISLASYVSLNEFKTNNYTKFMDEFSNSNLFNAFLLNIRHKCSSSESKKIKIVLNNLLVNYRNFILINEEIFFDYLKQIIHFDTVDVDNYDLVTRNLADIMITKFPGTNVYKYLETLTEILLKENLLNSNTNLTVNTPTKMEIESIGKKEEKDKNVNLNFTKKTIILNIYKGFLKYYMLSFAENKDQVENKSLAIFNSLCQIMNSSQYEIRDYISNDLLIYLLMSMKNSEKIIIAENLINKLKTSNADVYSANSNMNKEERDLKTSENLTVIFTLGTYLKFFDMSTSHLNEIDKIITAFRNFNSKILKNRGIESKLIKNIITDFFNRYKNTFEFTRLSFSQETIEAILDLSKNHSYYM